MLVFSTFGPCLFHMPYRDESIVYREQFNSSIVVLNLVLKT